MYQAYRWKIKQQVSTRTKYIFSQLSNALSEQCWVCMEDNCTRKCCSAAEFSRIWYGVLAWLPRYSLYENRRRDHGEVHSKEYSFCMYITTFVLSIVCSEYEKPFCIFSSHERLCGNLTGRDAITSHLSVDTVLIHFHTDVTYNHKGFEILYKFVGTFTLFYTFA